MASATARAIELRLITPGASCTTYLAWLGRVQATVLRAIGECYRRGIVSWAGQSCELAPP